MYSSAPGVPVDTLLLAVAAAAAAISADSGNRYRHAGMGVI